MGENAVSIRTDEPHRPDPNSITREIIREPAAEMLGTMILILVGTGVNCQFALSADVDVSPSPKGSYLGFNITWGCGLYSGLRTSLCDADCDPTSCCPGRVGFRWGVGWPY